jgi:lipopolysaccharide export system protein LptA
MSRLLLILSLFLILAVPGGAFAEEAKTKVKGPITITSESLTADNKEHTALFEKNVVARTTDMTIHADWMLVYYKEQGGDVTKIEAKGSVKVYQEAKVITANEMVYFADEEKVVFTGSPRAIDGDNVVTGTKITYYTRDDRSVVENSKVILKNKQNK